MHDFINRLRGEAVDAMPLTPGQISDRLPNGWQRQLATQLKVSDAYVSRVVNGNMQPRGARGRRTLRRIQAAIARRIGMPMEDVFGPALAPYERPEHARQNGRDVLGAGESRARMVVAEEMEGIRSAG